MARRLGDYVKDRAKEESLFGLTAASISGKIKRFAVKAGIKLHTHSLRDAFGTRLLERGATIREVQELLGHANLGVTERYTLLTAKHLRKAVGLLDDDQPQRKPGLGMPWDPASHKFSWELPQYQSIADRKKQGDGRK